jgi:hypothetical protein
MQGKVIASLPMFANALNHSWLAGTNGRKSNALRISLPNARRSGQCWITIQHGFQPR